jgi:hypothetical protein
MRTLWYAGLLLLTGIWLFACQSGNLDVGQSIINPQELQIQSIDSVTIQTSTVMRADSFPTTNDPDLVLGQWKDAQTGKLAVRTFIGFDYAANSLNTQTPTTLQVDSLVLELGYSFVYGDTTSTFDVSLYNLSKPLVSQLYYSNNSVSFDTKSYFQKTVIPQPLSRTRQVRFRFSDAVAQDLFNKLTNGEISDATTFSEFLPGFAMASNSTQNTFVGFSSSSTGSSTGTTTAPTSMTSGLRLYYHNTDINNTASALLFPVSALHFSQLQKDLSGTVLSALQARSSSVSSRLTDNTSFVALGSGLQTRIEFPFLGNFDRPDQFADLNSALLVVGPIRRDFRDNFSPPNQLALYFTNNQNDILPTAVPGGTAGVTSAIASYGYDPNALILSDFYTFDLTYYIGQIIKRKLSNQPMLLTLPLPTSGSSYSLRSLVQRVALGNQQRANDDRLQVKLFITSGV